MIRIFIVYVSMVLIGISVCLLTLGFRRKIYKMKVRASYLLGASLLVFGLMIPNPIYEWIFAIIGLIFLIAPNNMKEIDFNKVG